MDHARLFVGVLRPCRRGRDWGAFFGVGDDVDGDGACRFGDVVVGVRVVFPFVKGYCDAALVQAVQGAEQVLGAQGCPREFVFLFSGGVVCWAWVGRAGSSVFATAMAA